MPLGADADDEDPFDPVTSPADEDIGTLAEVFRERPTTRVNDHAAARFVHLVQGPCTSSIRCPLMITMGEARHWSGSATKGEWSCDSERTRIPSP